MCMNSDGTVVRRAAYVGGCHGGSRPDTVAERIARNSARPLLAGDAMARWETLFAAR
ncbi:hypothetical protein SAMN05216555_12329, partial [Arthrobacter cupressi]